ncbi:MAG: hypothetical protein IJI22_01540 [Bacilli bacterium]|nr:hypothetical protein [Bacilli bacterium]
MEIDLGLLHSNAIENIDISGSYFLDKAYYENTDIIDLKEIKVKGNITKKDTEEGLKDYIECSISGTMVIEDSISLEPIDFPYEIFYSDFLWENWLKSENILDIFSFLWENIVLEVPLQYTKVEDLSKFHGDGWRLVSEDDLAHNNNPFSELLKDIEEE